VTKELSSYDPIANGSKLVTDDGYNLTAFDQREGDWPIDHPLPLPAWSPRTKETIVIKKLWQYEDLVAQIEVLLHRMLEETHYDTVHNFLDFRKSYRASSTKDLKTFFQNYVPPINRRHHMCVSLAMEIVHRISQVRPELVDKLYLVSCEEAVDSTRSYIENCEERKIDNARYTLEKEHALVVMKIQVAGRDGMLVLDPGYHVARAVTVMKDQCYPHTGWFTQSDETHCKREYCYNISPHSDNFIEWAERMTRGGKETHEVSLVYVERPYQTAIDVTVRRNLVYNFRSLLARDAKGRVCAGLYFPVNANSSEAQMTLFYDGPNDSNVKVKQKIGTFKDVEKIPDSVKAHIEQLAPQLQFDTETLVNILHDIAEVIYDENFVKQVLAIEDLITEISADN
jgi:hypothetical protein